MISVKYAITATSGYAAGLLNNHSVCGTVHSVYRKTVNLSLDGELLALQAAASPLSPISLITALTAEEIGALGVTPGSPVLLQEHTVCLNDICLFDITTASQTDLLLSQSLSKEARTHLKGQILCALSCRDAGSFELLFNNKRRAGDIPFLAAAQKRLSDTRLALREQCWDSAAAALRRLIGLGLGLTPGGDDFLCGVLAGLILAGLSRHPFSRALSAQISGHLTDTNDISAAFLHCALLGQFSLAVNHLTVLPSPDEILSAFCEIGHSSGTDTLCGIYFALSCADLLEQGN